MSRKFSPANITDAQKERIISATNNYAESIKREIGKEFTFGDMIKDRIERGGLDQTDDIFNSLKYVWGLTGRDVSDADEVYKENFILSDDYSKLIYIDEINPPNISHKNVMDMLKNANINIENKQIERKPKVEVKLKPIEYLGIILMCLNVLYFIIEFLFHIFSDEKVFYFW